MDLQKINKFLNDDKFLYVMKSKLIEFFACMQLMEMTEDKIDFPTIKRCIKLFKQKNKEMMSEDEFLYICIIIMSCSTDDTVYSNNFECIFSEKFCNKKLLNVLNIINPALYTIEPFEDLIFAN